MTLPDLKALSKLIDLCKKKGISHITIGDMSLTLDLSAPTASSSTNTQAEPPGSITEDWKDPSDEELLFWSSETPKQGN